MYAGTINQTVLFDAAPQDVYDLLMDAGKHAAFSDSEVKMSTEVPDTFSTFNGYCHGYNIELDPGKKIVQAWNFAEEGWPDDHFSTCTFLFEEEDGKTKLSFSQTGIPEHKVKDLEQGWQIYYWRPMKAYLRGKSSQNF
ncbi:MAG: hypothetical protein K0R65_149 [Crocinitomicaceae bacterium]|jgi:activator of HSP90 ATPase|nr:hypothetical protein [Crocinitomicaceae bacterium]